MRKAAMDEEPDLQDMVTVLDEGRPVVKIGLLTSMYFRGAYQERVRGCAERLLEDYVRLCGPRLRWNTVPPNYTWARADANLVSSLRDRIDTTIPAASWNFTIHGGDAYDDASDSFVQALGLGDWKDRAGMLSYARAAFPIDFFAESPESFVATVVRWATWLRPVHGSGGLGILPSFGSDTALKHEPTVFSIAKHYPGLEVDYPSVHSLNGQKGIKGVNWLTILDDGYISRLGGLDALRGRIGDEFAMHPYEGGVVLQAGPKPEMGDRNRNRWPGLYVRLNAELKPIRSPDVFPFQHLGPNRFDLDASRAWLERFDR
jgi:hypothetical protein